ncbi:MAG: cytochrome c biogenesis CcdA family protein [Pyrinomonadaceae bacterium]
MKTFITLATMLLAMTCTSGGSTVNQQSPEMKARSTPVGIGESAPDFGGIIGLAATSGGWKSGLVLSAFYSAGLAVPFLLTGLGINQFLGFYGRFRRHLHKVEVFSGVVLIAHRSARRERTGDALGKLAPGVHHPKSRSADQSTNYSGDPRCKDG